MKLRRKLEVGAVVGCAALGVCSSVFSADEPTKGKNSEVIETIIVTAERQAQSMQKVPASIQAFTAEDLASTGIKSIDDLQRITQGLVMSEQGGQGHAYIRGIGTDIIGGGIEGGVAVYVDGVYQSRPSSTVFQFIDVERVEVMKGPQGTLYGRNATGGAINIITQAPSKVSEGQFDAQLGRFSDRTVRGTFSGPLSDGVASGRLSLLSNKNDGFMKNILLNNRGDSEIESVRGSVELTPSAPLSVRFNAHYYRKTDNGLLKILPPYPVFLMGAKVISDPFTVNSEGGPEENKQSGLDMTVKYDMDWARLTSITAIKKDKWTVTNYDNDGTEVPLVMSGSPTPMYDDSKMFSQDFTLTSIKDSPVQWTALVNFMHQKVHSPYSVNLPLFGQAIGSDATVTTDSYGIGGQASYSLGNGIKLTAGARYSSDKKKIDDINYLPLIGMVVATQNQEKTWSAWTPKIVAEYSPSKETLYFASVARGFKGGGFNTFTIQAPFNPENVTNYEAGIKTTLLNGRLRFNASAFSMKYSDMQLTVMHPSGVAVVSETVNAAKATINGIEIGVIAKPVPRLELSGGIQLLNARYDEFLTMDPLNPMLGLQNLKDNPLPYAPDSALNVGVQYAWPSAIERTDIIMRVDASRRSRLYFGPYKNDIISDAPLTLWNANLRFEPSSDKGIYGVIFIKNISDRRYSAFQNSTTLGTLTYWAQPRTFGILVGYRY